MSGKEVSNSKRIAKNTIFLYVRMMLMMVVTLYTSRVVLDALGVVDYGIYNVVGGVVAMFSMISGTLSASISRFLTYELGRHNEEGLKVVFSSAVTIQIGFAILVLIFVETVGMWFLCNKMVIPLERIEAAKYVLHFSAIVFSVNLISIPYNAVIIAHERMRAFAYISIIEAVGKLIIAYLITVSLIDRLVFYAILMCVVAVIIRLIYGYYCKKHFDECRYRFILQKDLLKDMFGFAGWNFIGSTAGVLRDQGGNILMNIFFGPLVNAARGIAIQVNSTIYSFANNFMTSLNPQIIKSYASEDYKYLMALVFSGARFSYYLLFILSLPVLISTHYILSLWLKVVPDYSVLFIQLIILLNLSEVLSAPLITVMLATGKIKKYQIIVGGFQLLNLPLSYLLLKAWNSPECIFCVAIFISQCCLIIRLKMLRGMVGLNVKDYFRKVYLNVFKVSVLATFVPILLKNGMNEGFVPFLILTLISLLSTLVTIYYVGCSRGERAKINYKLGKVIGNL